MLLTDQMAAISANMIGTMGRMIRIYAPVSAVTSDANVVPGAYTYVTQRTGSVVFGREVDDEVTALGETADQWAFLIFDSSVDGLIGARYVCVDNKGRAWMIRDRPATPEITDTVMVKCLGQFLYERPDGIPGS